MGRGQLREDQNVTPRRMLFAAVAIIVLAALGLWLGYNVGHLLGSH